MIEWGSFGVEIEHASLKLNRLSIIISTHCIKPNHLH